MNEKGKNRNRLVQFEPPLQPYLKPLPAVWDRERSRITRNNFIRKNIEKVSSAPPYGRRCRSADGTYRRCLNKSRARSYFIQTCAKDNDRAADFERSYKPSSIYRLNSFVFLNSLRDYPNQSKRLNKMSKPDNVVDSFVKLKTAEFESMTNGHDTKKPHSPPDVHENGVKETLYKKRSSNPNSNGHSNAFMGARRGSNRSRPKSSYGRQNRLLNSAQTSKSTPKLNRLESEVFEDDNGNKSENDLDNEDIDGDVFEYEAEPDFEPYFHRSLDKISSIANWERQVRYELEIEKELQRRELDRQKEKLQSDQRKLEEWDKQLRIELDARERKIRLTEDEYKSRLDEFEQRSKDLMRKEQMINEIVAERIKNEMKFEIEKLRKKFNELEVEKSNLNKKEERVKEVEARLHEQVKIVKEKIDGKRLSDIELAKYKKELEILKKENEVLKERVDTMDDYQVNKFENRALKSELQILKDSLDSKSQELERERDRWEKEQRATDQKIMNLRTDLRQAEQELVIYKQKSQGDLDEMTSKFEATNGQLKRLQIFVKDLLAKINSGSPGSIGGHYHQKSMPTIQYTKISPNATYYGAHHHHRRHNSLSASGPTVGHSHGVRATARSTSGSTLHPVGGRAATSGMHQRSVSMDDHDLMSVRRRTFASNARSLKGCNLCEDHNDDDYMGGHHQLSRSNDFLEMTADSDQFYNPPDFGEQRAIDDIFEEESINKHDYYHDDDNNFNQNHEQYDDHNRISEQPQTNRESQQTDEVVDKIVNRIYEKIHNSTNTTPTKADGSHKGPANLTSNSEFLKNDNLLISKLLASMAIEHVQNNEQTIHHNHDMNSHQIDHSSKHIGSTIEHVNTSPGSVMHTNAPTSDIINHNQHYQNPAQQTFQQQRIVSNQHYNIAAQAPPPPSEQTVQATSLYEELLPFSGPDVQLNIANSITTPATVPQNDNNNNSLLVSAQTKSTVSNVSNVVIEPAVGSADTVHANNAPPAMVSGTSQVGVSVINLSSSNVTGPKHSNDIQNKLSDDSSKSESFEVDW